MFAGYVIPPGRFGLYEPQDPKDPKTKVPLETMRKTYYRARGWDQDGVPTERTLKKLGIL